MRKSKQAGRHIVPSLSWSKMARLPCLFDSVQKVPDSRAVRSLLTRVAAAVVLIALPLSAWSQCAGWQSTAEARMACCAQQDQWPMHSPPKSATQKRVTKLQADTVCAHSERLPS